MGRLSFPLNFAMNEKLLLKTKSIKKKERKKMHFLLKECWEECGTAYSRT
jgi:hypothetical protein